MKVADHYDAIADDYHRQYQRENLEKISATLPAVQGSESSPDNSPKPSPAASANTPAPAKP